MNGRSLCKFWTFEDLLLMPVPPDDIARNILFPAGREHRSFQTGWDTAYRRGYELRCFGIRCHPALARLVRRNRTLISEAGEDFSSPAVHSGGSSGKDEATRYSSDGRIVAHPR